MGEFLEVAKVMVQPTMKLLEMCGNAIGTVYEPRHIRKIADAEAYKIKQLNSAIMESDNLPVSYENGAISMSTVDFEDFAKRAEFRAKYQMVCEQNNMENVVRCAYQELEGTPAVTSDPVDEDWTTRFFNIVKEVKTEEMHQLWGKILAGEVSEPSSFSLRTLETVRNLAKNEAEAFQKVCSCVLDYEKGVIIPQNLKLLEIQGVSYNDLVLLNEAGLVNLNQITFALDFPSNVEWWANFTNKKYILRITGKTEQATRFNYGIYKLTKAGSELYKIINSAPCEEYMCEVAKDIARMNINKASVNLHKIISCDGGEVCYEKEPIYSRQKAIMI